MKTTRILTAAATLALAPVLAVATPGTAQAKSSGRVCHSFQDGADGAGYSVCVEVVGHLDPAQREVYASFIENDTATDRTGDTCTSGVHRTYRWGGTVKVPREGRRWVFSQVARATSESFAQARTVGEATSATFGVPARSTRYCSYVERYERYDTIQCLTSSEDGVQHCRHRTFRAPAREGWIIGDAPAAA